MNLFRSAVVVFCAVAMSAIAVTQLAAEAIPDRASRIVVLPFDDFSGSEAAAVTIRAELVKAIEARGWTVVDSEQVEKVLEETRIRYFDSLEDDVRARILDEAGASAVLSGALYTFVEGKNPVVALSARMVRVNGTVVWGDIASISADETERMFGFGRRTKADDLVVDSVKLLIREFPRPDGKIQGGHLSAKPLFRSGPHVYTSPLSAKGPMRVCVLPFVNYSAAPEASIVVGEVLALRLEEAEGFQVVEPSTLRAAALETRIGSFRSATTTHLAKLAELVGTPYFLTGSIFDYSDSAGMRGETPELELEFSLVDVRDGHILWTTQHARNGSDYTGFLMLGTVSNAVSLSDHVVSEMIRSGEKGLSKNAHPVAGAHARLYQNPEQRSDLNRTGRKEKQ